MISTRGRWRIHCRIGASVCFSIGTPGRFSIAASAPQSLTGGFIVGLGMAVSFRRNENDLPDVFKFVGKDVIAFSDIFKWDAMADHRFHVDAAGSHVLEHPRNVALHIALAGADR